MPNSTAGKFKVGDWTVDPQLDEISRGGEVVKLEPRMMRLLLRLSESAGQVLSTPQLLDSVWSGVVVGPASVYQAVSALRKLLGDTDPTPTYIATVTRKGYRLIAPVTSCEPEAVSPEPNAVPATDSAPTQPRRWIPAVPAAVLVAIAAAWYFWPRHGAVVGAPAPAPSAQAIAKLPRLVVPDFIQAEDGDEAKIFAIGISDLFRMRLVTQSGLVLILNFPSYGLLVEGKNLLEEGRRVGTQYVLKGTAGRVGEQLHLDVELVNVNTGKSLWSESFDRPTSEMTRIREQVVARIAESLQVPLTNVGNRPVDLDQHQLFMRAQLMMVSGLGAGGPLQPGALFTRATVLYPRCARCYLGLAISLLMQGMPANSYRQRVAEASVALDRAIELDPELGEAIFEKAGLIEDPVKAEQMFRRGLALAPYWDLAHMRYGLFLERMHRTGEAIDVYASGLSTDPRSDLLLVSAARVAGFSRGDVPRFDSIMRQVIAQCPECNPGADLWLARSRLVWSGEAAEALKIVEGILSREQSDFDTIPFATAAYLEVDDPDAASAVAGKNILANLQISQYRGQRQNPASLPDELKQDSFPAGPGLGVNPLAEALRDEAIATRQYQKSLDSLAIVFNGYKFPAPGACKVSLAEAHVMILSGRTEEGREKARGILALLDNESIGRPPDWFARDRAAAYMLLGDHEHAIAELQKSQKLNNFVRWWYTGEFDPLFAPLHADPRFQVLVAAARKHRVEQRALVDEMRRKGELPVRAPRAAAGRN